MVLICKNINQRSNINTYRNNLIKYNRIIPTNVENTINILSNEIPEVNIQIYENINKLTNDDINIDININISSKESKTDDFKPT